MKLRGGICPDLQGESGYCEREIILHATKKSITNRPFHFSIILLGLILFNVNYSFSATYYFSSTTGNDSYSSLQARNLNTPWRSLDKLNAIFSTLLPGDLVLFKRGDVFAGSIVPTKSGTSSLPIVFGAYGTGSQPQVNAFVKLSSWTSLGNGIYESPCSEMYGNNLLLNGAQQAMGRYPNKGYLSFESHYNNSSITDNQLSSYPNWTGAEVVVRKDRWTLDRSLITSHSGGTIHYASGTSATPINGYGYFIQKHPQTLDQSGEWYYDSNRKMMSVFFGASNPASYVVQVSAVNTLVNIQNCSFITFRDIAFIGAGKNAFKLTNTSNISLDNCTLAYSGDEAVLAGWSPNFSIQNSIINHSLSGGLNFDSGCHNASVLDNQIKNTALFAGLGRSGSGTYEAIGTYGDNTKIERNTIDSTGYNGIYLGGNNALVKNNLITTFCIVKDDGGGIYVSDWTKWYNKKIINNIIINGVGAGDGTSRPDMHMAEGIYVDDLSESVTISGNTVSMCATGIKIHNGKDINIFNNTSYNNGVQLRLEQDHYIWQSTYIRNNNIKNNIFFAKTDAQSTSIVSSHQDDIREFGHLDSNSYSRPLNDFASIGVQMIRNGNYEHLDYDLPDWRTKYGHDATSTKSPLVIPTYKISQLLGSNKFANGRFNTNVDGLYCYSSVGDGSGTYATGILDGGSLRLSFNNTANNNVVVNMRAGAVEANKKYILRFTALGIATNSVLKSYLRTTGSPFAEITDVKTSKINTARTNYEVLLTSKSSSADASIIFDIPQATGQVYIDNVELFQAEVVTIKPDDYILFEYNATNSVKTIPLNRAYVDVYNNHKGNSISLAPYTSAVLIASDDAPLAKMQQTVAFVNPPSSVSENTPVTLSAVASSGLATTLKVLSGPGTLAGNTLSFTGPGTVSVQALQAGNERYNPAIATIEITSGSKTAQTLIFVNLPTSITDGAPVALHTFASSGLPVTHKVLSGPGSIANNVVSFNGFGVVSIEASQAGNNQIAAVAQTFQITNTTSSAITKTAQTIAFGSIPGTVSAGTPVTINATASSGLAVTLKVVSGPGVLSGNVLSFTGAGTVTIQANQSGSESFESALATAQVTNVISSKAAQAIIFVNLPATVSDGAPIALHTFASSGLPVTHKVLSGPAYIVGNVISFSGFGVVSMEASQAGNNQYEAVSKAFQITNTSSSAITKTTQTIAFGSLPGTVSGGTPATINATASSGLVVTLRVVSGPGVLSGNVLSFTGAGTVTIQANQSGSDRFEAASATAQVTNVISSKAAQSLIFVNLPASVTYGMPVALHTFATSGLPVTHRVLSGPGYIVNNVVSFNGFGAVSIEASQAGDNQFTAVAQTFQINNTSSAIAYTSSTMGLGSLPGTASGGTNMIFDLDASRVGASANPQLKAFPNPFVSKLTVEFSMPSSGNASLMLYDLQGRFLSQLYLGPLIANQMQTVVLDAESLGLRDGIYLIRMVCGKEVLYQKVILAR